VRLVNDEVVRGLDISAAEVEAVVRSEQLELERRERLYRGASGPLDVRGRTAILIDDGLATGSTMRVAIQALRRREAGRIVAAVPTGAPDTCEMLRREADEVVCATTPEPFRAVGLWYRDFDQTDDDEVRALLARAQAGAAQPQPTEKPR